MPVDLTAITAGIELVTKLREWFEKFDKRAPNVVPALTLVSQLHQHIDYLRARVVELETKNLELERRSNEQEAWQARVAGLFFSKPLEEQLSMPERGNRRFFARHALIDMLLIPSNAVCTWGTVRVVNKPILSTTTNPPSKCSNVADQTGLRFSE